jgi:hypothetical protein
MFILTYEATSVTEWVGITLGLHAGGTGFNSRWGSKYPVISTKVVKRFCFTTKNSGLIDILMYCFQRAVKS